MKGMSYGSESNMKSSYSEHSMYSDTTSAAVGLRRLLKLGGQRMIVLPNGLCCHCAKILAASSITKVNAASVRYKYYLYGTLGFISAASLQLFRLHLCLGGPKGLQKLLCNQRSHKNPIVVEQRLQNSS